MCDSNFLPSAGLSYWKIGTRQICMKWLLIIRHVNSVKQCQTVSTVSTVSTVIARCYLHLRWYFWNQITIIIIDFLIFAAPSSSSSLPLSISSSQKLRTSGLRLKFENSEMQTVVELFVFQMIQKFFSPSVTQWHTNMRDVITWEIFLKLVFVKNVVLADRYSCVERCRSKFCQ